MARAKKKVEQPKLIPRADYHIVECLTDIGVGRGQACGISRLPGRTLEVCRAAIAEQRRDRNGVWIGLVVNTLRDDDAVTMIADGLRKKREATHSKAATHDAKQARWQNEVKQAREWLADVDDAAYEALHEKTATFLRGVTPGDPRKPWLREMGPIANREDDIQAVILWRLREDVA